MKKALVLAFAFVVALGVGVFADALTGSWTTNVCMDGSPNFTKFASTLVVDYEICGWTFGGTFGFGVGGWETVAFDVYGALGAFAIDSDIVFSPADAAFRTWMSTVDLAIAGVDLTLGYDLVMAGTPMVKPGDLLPTPITNGYSYWTIAASGAAGLCNVGVTAGFGGAPDWEVTVADHCFCFDYIDFTFDFPFLCGTTVYVTAGFSTLGFSGLCLDITGLYFVELPWLTFDFGLCFDEGTFGKSFSFVPAISLTDACDEDAGYISLFVEIYSEGATFDGINVYGVDIYKAWNGIWFEDITIWDTDEAALYWPLLPAGIWEAMGIGTVGDSCCGGDFAFTVWTYFAANDYLFDWALTTVDLSFGIGSNFDVTSSFQISSAGLLELCLGFAVSW